MNLITPDYIVYKDLNWSKNLHKLLHMRKWKITKNKEAINLFYLGGSAADGDKIQQDFTA